ncbi:MAG TPA: Na(+)/H(+) antiporter subunit A, partial [Devosia sp.]|nr:Na(+)/H(+) antiporter subunit A [Devosia sp.]
MNFDLDAGITLAALAPFIAAFLAPFLFRFTRHYSAWLLALVPASIFGYMLHYVAQMPRRQFVSAGYDWVPSYGLRLSFYLDQLAVSLALLVSGVATLALLHAGPFLKGNPGQGRFMALLLAATGAMLGLVMADNLVSLFIFWELAALSTFFLVGFDHERRAARRAAIHMLLVNAIGGLTLLAAFLLLHQMTGNWEISTLFQFGPAIREQPLYPVILILVLVAAFIRSAQFPFHFWLQNALEMPAPAAAFTQSTGAALAGIYILMRMNPILGGATLWDVILPIFGGLTLLWGAFGALRQTDLAQILTRTTVSALGLMVLLLGIGTQAAFSAVVMLLFSHAFFKCALVTVAGNVERATGTREITELGGLWKPMPLTFLGALLGLTGMLGLPFTLAFQARQEMYAILFLDRISDLFLNWQNTLVVLVMVLANAIWVALGLAILVRLFTGRARATPLSPREGAPFLWLGTLVLGAAGLWAGTWLDGIGYLFLTPIASSIANIQIDAYLYSGLGAVMSLQFAITAITWLVGIVLFLSLDDVRTLLRELPGTRGGSLAVAADYGLTGLVRLSRFLFGFVPRFPAPAWTMALVVLFSLVILAPLVPVFSIPDMAQVSLPSFLELLALLVAVLGLFGTLFARTRRIGLLSLLVAGVGIALLFVSLGAPETGLAQIIIANLCVALLVLLANRRGMGLGETRSPARKVGDAALSVAAGLAIAMLTISVLQVPLDQKLADFYVHASVPLAGGRNVIDVLLMDFRALDTFV